MIQTLSFFLKDKAKKLLLSMVLLIPIMSVVIAVVQNGGDYFFFYVWILISVIILLLMTVYPEFIAPLFDKYTPLPDCELKRKIEAFAIRVAFPLKKLYVVHGSKRSSHSNAYMYGFWKNKRIVLYDTLLSDECNELLKKTEQEERRNKGEKEEESVKEQGDEEKRRSQGMQDDEVVAVLGHELGHWDLYHTLCNLCIAEMNILLMLAAFAYFYKQRSLYLAFGFSTTPTLIGLLIVFQFIMAPYNEVLGFAMTLLSRRLEFAADRYAAELGHAEPLGKALIKLSKDNLSLPIDDHLFSTFNHSHPPVPERISALKRYQ